FERVPQITGGRYGLSSKEFTPAMVKGIFDELSRPKPKNHFTIGINDDVTNTSISYDPDFDIEPQEVSRAVFWGLGSDGTVGANKNTIKIIGEETDAFAQGYFVYDSRKSGARTISHLRFGPQPIHSTYLIRKADFVAVHQFDFLEKYDTLAIAGEGATFLLNSPFDRFEVWNELPRGVQRQIVEKHLRFYVVDAFRIARDAGLDGRINTIMQTCHFALSGVLPRDEAIAMIKKAVRSTYSKRGEEVVRMNDLAIDHTLAHLHEVSVPETFAAEEAPSLVSRGDGADFFANVTARILAGEGDSIPVSQLPDDGTYPSGTTKFEKRNLALEVPVWDADICIQCGKCVMVCPHAVIRAKAVDADELATAPNGFLAVPARWREMPDKQYTLQVSVEDCTGCRLCVEICPVEEKSAAGDGAPAVHKALNMQPQRPLREKGRENWDFFLQLPETSRSDALKFTKSKDIQLLQPLFEFSGACSGCGETPYLILMTRLFGDRT
ncbi:MAG: 2-oxoacid:acceptor oxidoreductase family protein, partial [Rhodothermales bacterium]